MCVCIYVMHVCMYVRVYASVLRITRTIVNLLVLTLQPTHAVIYKLNGYQSLNEGSVRYSFLGRKCFNMSLK
jgi:hypothetical protein